MIILDLATALRHATPQTRPVHQLQQAIYQAGEVHIHRQRNGKRAGHTPHERWLVAFRYSTTKCGTDDCVRIPLLAPVPYRCGNCGARDVAPTAEE